MSNNAVAVQIPALYVRWKVNATKDARSSEFMFQDGKWSLWYHLCGSQLCLGLHPTPERNLSLYSVAVHVEDAGTGRIVAALSNEMRLEINITFVWQMMVSEVEVAYPAIKEKQELSFLVVLKADDFLTEDNSACTLCKSLSPASVPCLESLSADFGKLMDQGSNPDVEFRCGDLSTKAHRLVVCSRSPVIASMMSSDMVESRTGIINIPNMQPDTFQKFLKYLYTGKLEELSFDTALGLYEAGDHYTVLGLAKRCKEFLLRHLTAQNACQVLVIADAHSDDVFKEAVVSFMLDKKVPQEDDQWPTFCDSYPRLAFEVMNRFYNAATK